MPFDRSQIQLISFKPWRWVDEQAGTKQEIDGVFILLSDELADKLTAAMTAAQWAEFEGWFHHVTAKQAARWHVPIWAGDRAATYIRIPAAVWNDPTTAPPAKVRGYFQWLWNS